MCSSAKYLNKKTHRYIRFYFDVLISSERNVEWIIRAVVRTENEKRKNIDQFNTIVSFYIISMKSYFL